MKAPRPTDKHQLRSLLGLVNYYGKFVPNLSSVVSPLNRLLRNDVPWSWSDQCESAYRQLKGLLSAPPVLTHYDPTAPLQLSCDASAYGIGAVLSHVDAKGQCRPIAYASRTLSKAETGYSQIEKEALALVFGVKRFHYYLYGRTFVLVTDHKPLHTILGPKTGIPTIAAARLQRWAVLLSAYTYTLKFKSSAENADSDCLSRLPLPDHSEEPSEERFYVLRFSTLPVNCRDVARETCRDPVLKNVLHYVMSGWPDRAPSDELKPFFHRRCELSLQQGCLVLGTRVVIPKRYQSFMLEELHQGHPGIVRTKELARSYVWWPTIDRDIERQVSACQSCQSQRNLPCPAPLHPWAWPTRPWERVHVDFAGPFKGTMLLVVIDAHSKWPEVFVMKKTSAEKTISCLRDLFCRFGFPETLVSDNGPQFTSTEFAEYMRSIGTRHVRTAPYHPSSNGQAERFVQSLKASLRKSEGLPLQSALADFLLAYRNTPHTTTGEAPAVLLLGRRLRTRLDAVKPSIQATVAARQFTQTLRRGSSKRHERHFTVGDSVKVRNFRRGEKWLPGIILARTGPVTYKLSVMTPRGVFQWTRHRNHIVRVPPEEDTSAPLEPIDSSGAPLQPATGQDLQPAPVHPSAQRRYPLRQRQPPERYQS